MQMLVMVLEIPFTVRITAETGVTRRALVKWRGPLWFCCSLYKDTEITKYCTSVVVRFLCISNHLLLLMGLL